MNRLRKDAGKAIVAAQAEVKKIERDLDKLVDTILRGGNAEKISLPMLVLESRKRDLEGQLTVAKEPPPILHPGMAHRYRVQLDGPPAHFSERDDCHRLNAEEIIRSVIERVVLTLKGKDLVAEMQGDIAGILKIAAQRKRPPRRRA